MKTSQERDAKQLIRDVELMSYMRAEHDLKPGMWHNVNGRIHIVVDETKIRFIDKAGWLNAGPDIEVSHADLNSSDEVIGRAYFEAKSLVRKDPIALDHVQNVRLGDAVFYYVGENGYGDGTQNNLAGEVIAFTRKRYAHDWTDFGKEPLGIYEKNEGVVVQWSTGVITVPKLWNLFLVDQGEMVARHADMEGIKKLNEETRVADLPKERFYQGDIVNYRGFDKYYFEEARADLLGLAKIEGVTFDCSLSGDVEVRYRLLALMSPRMSQVAFHNEVSMWAYGNLSRWVMDQKDMLEFKDYEEKRTFFIQLSIIEQVRNKQDLDFYWSLDHALTAFTLGEVDDIQGTLICVVKEVNSDEVMGLKKEMRQLTIEKYKDEFARLGLQPTA